MIDFQMSVLFTVMVSVLTILADWLASRFIVGANTIRSITQIVRSDLTPEEANERTKDELDRFRSYRFESLAWGADLAIVAMSMDFAALGIWTHKPEIFPFFLRFNEESVSRELPVWMIVIGLHAMLLITSLVFKHKHADKVSRDGRNLSFFSKSWFLINGWILASHLTGMASLLGAMIVFTNAI